MKIVFSHLLFTTSLFSPLFFLLIFSGCEKNMPQESSELQTLVETQREIMNRESSYFSVHSVSEDTYAIIVNNPKELSIQSLQFSILVPGHLAEIANFTQTEDSKKIFPLLLKEKSDSFLSFSLAQDGEAQKLESAFVLGEFVVTKKSETPFHLSFFDGGKGNSIQIIENGKTVNVLDVSKLEDFIVQ